MRRCWRSPPEEVKAAILLFYGLLDEQQRRLYAGRESLKLGRGGDRQLADFLDLDPRTVTRGRYQMFSQDVEVDLARKAGAGRKRVEKNARNNRCHRDSSGARYRRRSITGLKGFARPPRRSPKFSSRSIFLYRPIRRLGFCTKWILSARQPQTNRHQLQPLPRSAVPAYLLAPDSLSAAGPSHHQRRQ
jgi:hypothetical protein